MTGKANQFVLAICERAAILNMSSDQGQETGGHRLHEASKSECVIWKWRHSDIADICL